MDGRLHIARPTFATCLGAIELLMMCFARNDTSADRVSTLSIHTTDCSLQTATVKPQGKTDSHSYMKMSQVKPHVTTGKMNGDKNQNQTSRTKIVQQLRFIKSSTRSSGNLSSPAKSVFAIFVLRLKLLILIRDSHQFSIKMTQRSFVRKRLKQALETWTCIDHSVQVLVDRFRALKYIQCHIAHIGMFTAR